MTPRYVVVAPSKTIVANTSAQLCERRYTPEDAVYTVIATGAFDEMKELAERLNKIDASA